MEQTNSKLPRKITDEHEAICSRCNEVIYVEKVVATLQEDGSYKHERFVFGSYKQECDHEGIPTGAIIPFCNCKNSGE